MWVGKIIYLKSNDQDLYQWALVYMVSQSTPHTSEKGYNPISGSLTRQLSYDKSRVKVWSYFKFYKKDYKSVIRIFFLSCVKMNWHVRLLLSL